MPMTTALSHEPSRVDAPISDFDPYAEDVLDNPYPHYEVLRELGPIVHLQRYGVYAIARHAEIDAVLRDHVTFCSSAGVGLANFHTEEPWRKPSLILEADPPMHGRTRKVVAGLLAPASINKLRPTFEREAELLIDKNWKAVAGLTDRNLILVKGRVVLEGTGEQLRAQPDRLAEYLGV